MRGPLEYSGQKRLKLFSGNWCRGWGVKAQREAGVNFASGLVGVCSMSEHISTMFKTVVLKVCSPSQQHLHPLGMCYEHQFLGLIPDLLNQKFWERGPKSVFYQGDSVACEFENLLILSYT